MNLTAKILEENKVINLRDMFHNYSITKEQVDFYVVGYESWFEIFNDKKVLFKLTDEEKEVNLFLKGTVHLNSVCDADDGYKGLYILEVTDWKKLNN